jgi:hypothetical protein
VTGTGTARIGKGALNIAASIGETVIFVTGATGQLRLTDFKDFTGKVSGLSTTGSNTIDLATMAFVSGATKATYSGTTASGVLTVTNGTLAAHVTLLGNYVGHAFAATSDGHGGTLVRDPPTAFAQAMAAHAPAPAVSATPLAHPPPRLLLGRAHS